MHSLLPGGCRLVLEQGQLFELLSVASMLASCFSLASTFQSSSSLKLLYGNWN